MSEFEEDLSRLSYVKRLIRKYKSSGDLKERLILNHIIVLTNVFGVEPAIRMLFFIVIGFIEWMKGRIDDNDLRIKGLHNSNRVSRCEGRSD